MNSSVVTGSPASGGARALPVLGTPAVTVPIAGSGPSPPHAARAPDLLQHAAQHVVDAMQAGGVSFKFSIDKQSGLTIVRIYNKETGELVRQIPGEEVVHVAALLRQDEQHTLLDLTV